MRRSARPAARGRERPCGRRAEQRNEFAPSHCRPRGSIEDRTDLSWHTGRGNVRFGSKADMCSAKGHVRFTPKSRQTRM